MGLGTMDVVEVLDVVTTVGVDATMELVELVSVARAGEGVTESDCPVAVVR